MNIDANNPIKDNPISKTLKHWVFTIFIPIYAKIRKLIKFPSQFNNSVFILLRQGFDNAIY